MDDLDPHWEWHELHAWGETAPVYVKGACKHLETVPVLLANGEHVAQLCLACDAQLPPRAAEPAEG